MNAQSAGVTSRNRKQAYDMKQHTVGCARQFRFANKSSCTRQKILIFLKITFDAPVPKIPLLPQNVSFYVLHKLKAKATPWI